MFKTRPLPKHVVYYIQVFNKICKDTENSQVRATADFERAIWNALATVMPWIKIVGCLFHLKQAIRKNLQAKCLKFCSNIENMTLKEYIVTLVNLMKED